MIDKRKIEIKTQKKVVADGKSNSSIFRAISRGSREKILLPKKVSPRMNELGIFPVFFSAKNAKLFLSKAMKGDHSIEKLKKFEEENVFPQTAQSPSEL